MEKSERIAHIRKLWAEAPAQCRFDRSISVEEAQKKLAEYKMRDDAMNNELVATHGEDAATLTVNIDAEIEPQLLHVLINEHDNEVLANRYEELAIELVELGAAEVAIELAENLDDSMTGALTDQVVWQLLERKEHAIARKIARRRHGGQDKINTLLTMAESTKDPADIHAARSAILKSITRTNDSLGIGLLFRSKGVGYLARLWRASNDPRDLARAREACQNIEPISRSLGLRAIARHTWLPKDVYAALAAIERNPEEKGREEEFALFALLIATEYRRRKGDKKELFSVMINQITEHLKEERWRRILRRETNDLITKEEPPQEN